MVACSVQDSKIGLRFQMFPLLSSFEDIWSHQSSIKDVIVLSFRMNNKIQFYQGKGEGMFKRQRCQRNRWRMLEPWLAAASQFAKCQTLVLKVAYL